MTRPNRISAPNALVTGLIGFLLLSCAARPPAPTPTPGFPYADAAQAVAALETLERNIRNVAAQGKVEYFKGGRHERVGMLWTIAKPDRGAFEVTGPLGLIGAITFNASEFRFYVASENKILYGPMNEGNLKALFPWRVRPEEFIPLLCGAPKPRPGASVRSFGPDPQDAGTVRMVRKDARTGDLEGVWFKPDGALYKVQRVVGGHVEYEVTYLDWTRHGEVNFPGFIRLIHPESGSAVTFRLKGVPQFNRDLPPSTFELPFPEGVERGYRSGE